MRTHTPSFAPRLAPLALLVAMSGLACGGTTEAPPVVEPPLPDPVEPFPSTDATSIAFERQSARLSLTAGVPTTVAVRVQPAGLYTVRFAVVGENTSSLFLSANQVETDTTGLASVVIHARGTSSSEHTLRAAVGDLETSRLFLDVDQSSNATLIVQPLAPEGSVRAISEWVLSAHLDKVCADLEGTPPPDGELKTTAAYTGPAQQVVLQQVPAGRDLAVVVRAGQFAGGCKNMRALIPSSQTVTEIDVNQRPMHLDETSLALQFGPDTGTEFDTLYADFSFRSAGAFAFGDGDDLDAVFNAMASLSANPVDFELARTVNQWRALWLIEEGTALAGAGTRDLLRGWMQSGLAPLTRPEAFAGVLSPPNDVGEATFALTAVDGFAALGVPTLVADANDFLRVNLSLRWSPSGYLLPAATRQALSEFPGTTSVPEALAAAFDCPALGASLVASNPVQGDPAEAYAGCGADCVEQLCQSALTLIWGRVELSPLPAMQWDFTGAAQAQVDNEARPASVEGGSLHSLSILDPSSVDPGSVDLPASIENLSVTGTFRATALPPASD